ncbi:MAG: fused response regulator/phosphatase [Syntrophobacteraceae bacterium]
MSEMIERRSVALTPLVLIIDDDPTTTLMLKGILGQCGFRTACATDGAGGIGLALNLLPDLILLDVHLPDLDGFTVCRKILQDRGAAEIPILFISANDDVDSKVKGFDAGGIDYITKPLSGVEVIARVRTHLRLRHVYDALAKLQAERIQRLAKSQEMILPSPESIKEANFAVSLSQIHGAGGDFYDVIPVGGSLIDYFVADASGHELETSLWTTAMKTLLHEHASPLFDPDEILRVINRSLCRVMPEGQFFTALYVRVNRRTGRLTIVNCGHPSMICLPIGNQPSVIAQTGDVIGAFTDARFQTKEILLNRGDRFIMYTDGLTGAGNSNAGIKKLLQACGWSRHLQLATMVREITGEMSTGAGFLDDVVILGVEI